MCKHACMRANLHMQETYEELALRAFFVHQVPTFSSSPVESSGMKWSSKEAAAFAALKDSQLQLCETLCETLCDAAMLL